MKTRSTPLFLFAAMLLFSGCITTGYTRLDASADYPPVHADDVVIYLDEFDIPGDYEKVALIHAEAPAELTRRSTMFKKMRRQAGKLGANGILYREVDEPSAGAKVAGAALGTGTKRMAEMIAIYVYPAE